MIVLKKHKKNAVPVLLVMVDCAVTLMAIVVAIAVTGMVVFGIVVDGGEGPSRKAMKHQ